MFFLSENFRIKIQNLRLKNPIPYFVGNVGGTEILSTHNVLRRKFAAVCRNKQLSAPRTFNPQSRWY